MYNHPMYVCDSCKFSQYHPIRYCPKCPGRLRLVKKEIPHPEKFKTEEDLQRHVESQGLEYFGEYARFDTDGKLVKRGV